ncbi:MAG: hypothetical protein CVV47_03745 [Spirochaetae bacterium HGW-Spirochaetae-3]|jgi:broad specificity phosphatase PhoE|nr:MAG: hypothetical protein CVV47_03745 [Spirochaetae bacterium HGW-Spirochaetae-3]
MTLYVVRHAEKEASPEWDPERKFDDRRISQRGHRQADALVSFFRDKGIRRIFTSEYTRTDETIRPLYLEQKVEVHVDGLLNEIGVGAISDPSISSARRQALVSRYQSCIDEERDFKYVGGESGSDVVKRIRKFLERIEGLTGDTVIVTHEGWIKLLVCHLLNVDPGKRFRLRIDTCGLLVLEKESGAWKIRLSGIA